jgi:hypothetical protein
MDCTGFLPAILPHIRDPPQFGVVSPERCSGVFDVVDVMDSVAVVSDLPDGEGFGFMHSRERSQS